MEKINTYINNATWEVKENANMGYSVSGLQLALADDAIKNHMLENYYKGKIAKSYNEGYMHIHDLGMGLTCYCMGHDLKEVLEQGFNGVTGKVQTTPAKHMRTAIGHMINYLFTNQSENAGAQAFNNVDTLLAPYVRNDNLSYEEIKQNMQEFIYNMNVANRVGFQAPFSNVTFDLKCPSQFKLQKPKINNVVQDFTYGELNKEIGLIAKAFFEVMMEGDGAGQPFTFPIPTVNLHKDFVWDDDVAMTIFEATAKYGTANFQNFLNSDLNPEDTYSMCPVVGETEVIVKTSKGNKVMPIQQLFHNQNNKNAEYKTFYNGSWDKALVTEQGKQNIYNISLYTGETLKFGENHLQNVYGKGTIKTSNIKEGDYIPYNTYSYDTTLGDYKLGYIIGLYAGDGSNDGKSGLTFSLNTETDEDAGEEIKKYFNNMGYTVKTTIDNHLRTVRVNGKSSIDFIKRYINGTALTKEFNQRIFDMSQDCRQGILDGWYKSDGGNRGRIYTFSEKMKNQFMTICTSLGHVGKLDYVDTRENRLGNKDNPCYVVKYLKSNKYGDLFFTENGIKYIKVEKITKEKKQKVYCFNVDNDEHQFVLANGVITHNCRLRLDKKELIKNSGGLFGSGNKTGSIGVVTINLPMIAYEASQIEMDVKPGEKSNGINEKAFVELLTKHMDLAKESLEIKRSIINDNLARGLMPYSNRYIGTYKNHFSTIAILGANEMCTNLIGEDITTKGGQEFTKRVLDFMRNRISEYQEETGNYYNLEQAPAEGAATKLAKKAIAKYSDIKTAGTTDRPYFTNSTHLPVNHNMSLFKMLKTQDEFNEYYNGGTIVHCFLGQKVTDWINCMLMVKKIAEKTKLPFFDLSPTFSICPVHGYISGEHHTCPLEHSEEDLKKFGIIAEEN